MKKLILAVTEIDCSGEKPIKRFYYDVSSLTLQEIDDFMLRQGLSEYSLEKKIDSVRIVMFEKEIGIKIERTER